MLKICIFLITRAGLLVTHIYEHFTFEQSRFKKDFVVMNQKSRQKTTTPVKKDFCKLLNNCNFGIDCRNNIDNCVLEPLFDDFEEISYLKKFTSIFNDETFRDFYSPCLLKEEIIQTFQSKIFALNKEDPLYITRKQYRENKMEEELDDVDSFGKKNKQTRKRKFKNIDEKILDCLDPRKTKMIVGFNSRESSSIKSFSVKKEAK